MRTTLLKRIIFSGSLLVFILSLFRCSDESNEGLFSATPWTFPSLKGFPTNLNIPADNPMTKEGIELGRYLFYDGRLSGRLNKDSLMSCGTCHLQSRAFESGVDHPKFTNGHPRGMPTPAYPLGKQTPHVMLPVVNLAYNTKGYMWNGFLESANEMTGIPGYDFSGISSLNFKNLEAFTYMAIVAEHEINGTIDKTVQAIRSDDQYKPLFKKAFGTEEINGQRISYALSQFIRSIISYRSRYHQWLRQEAQLTESELRGFDLFFSEKADCFHCHGGTALLTNYDYFNNAKDAVPEDSKDRFSITKLPWDIGAYRAPSLINTELNGPYMHDGRFKTLDEVIDFYSEGLVNSEYAHPLMKNVNQGGVHLTDAEKADLKAFLLTLTDHALLEDPTYHPPASLGDWSVK